MKKILVLFMFLPLFVYPKPNNDSIVNVQLLSIEQRLSDIESANFERDIKYLDKRLQDNENLTEKSFSSISAQLSVSEVFVGGVSVILTVLGLFLGLYINKKYKQVEQISQQVINLKSDNEELLRKATIAKEEVEKINNSINSNMSDIYEKVKREETVSLLCRLVDVPQDISNLGTLLLSRKLECSDFDKLKTAYLKLGSLIDSSSFLNDPKSSYQTLFFQHFFVQSINDRDISKDIIEFISDGIECAFENDIENTTKEFSILLRDENIAPYNNVVIEYFKGLSQSKFKTYKRIYEIFFETIDKREKQFELFDTVISSQETKIAKIEYGLFVKEQYSNVELTEKEQKSFEELIKLQEEYPNEKITKKNKEVIEQKKVL